MNGPMDEGKAVGPPDTEEKMALKDLERLTGELEELACLLKQETRPPARWIIMQRVQEIMDMIGKGIQ